MKQFLHAHTVFRRAGLTLIDNTRHRYTISKGAQVVASGLSWEQVLILAEAIEVPTNLFAGKQIGEVEEKSA